MKLVGVVFQMYCGSVANQSTSEIRLKISDLSTNQSILILFRYNKQNKSTVFLSCHIRVRFSECQGTPCLKQTQYLSLSDCSGIQTYYHLVRKQTFNHLAKLAK